MKKIALLVSAIVFAFIVPLQTYAASLSEVRSYVKNNYYGDINGDIYDASTIDELMNMLDPYSVYYTEEQYNDLIYSLNNELIGIGIVVDIHEQGVYIAEVLKDGPAYTAGLQIGDIITHADGVSLAGMPLSNALNYIKGAVNTVVQLKVLHKNGSTQSHSLTRKVIKVSTVEQELLYGNVGYIYLSSYTEDAGQLVSNAINNLTKAGATHFIFDIRDNGGGYVNAALDIISLFPNAVNGFLQLDAGGKYLITLNDYLQPYAKRFSKFTANTSLLINGNSASASDMTAGAVKDQNLAKIYGSTSYGKGLMQTIDTFHDGSAIKLTIAEFRTPNGNVINKTGIKPDVETQTPLEDAHFDAITSRLAKYKSVQSLANVPTSKTFTVTLSDNVSSSITNDSIEFVQLGGSKVEIQTKVQNNKINVTPTKPLQAGAQYVLIVHPTIKNSKGKKLASGSYMHITVAK